VPSTIEMCANAGSAWLECPGFRPGGRALCALRDASNEQGLLQGQERTPSSRGPSALVRHCYESLSFTSSGASSMRNLLAALRIASS
jgi:hypothetical protein